MWKLAQNQSEFYLHFLAADSFSSDWITDTHSKTNFIEMNAGILAFRKIQNIYKIPPWIPDLGFLQITKVEFFPNAVWTCGYNSMRWYILSWSREWIMRHSPTPRIFTCIGRQYFNFVFDRVTSVYWKWIKYYIWPYMNRKFIRLCSPKWTVKIKLFYTAGPVRLTRPRSMTRKQLPTKYPEFKSIFQISHACFAPASK